MSADRSMPGAKAKAMIEMSDGEWLLASAILMQVAEDLAMMRAAKWWEMNPSEMRGRNVLADRVLREVEGSVVETLFDVVRSGTGGRVQMGHGWLVRVARRLPIKGHFDYRSIERRMQDVPTRHWTKEAGIDLTCMPKGPTAYQAERRRRILEAGYCMCGSRLEEGSTYCAACLREKALKGSRGPRKKQAVEMPEGAMLLKEWIAKEAAARGVTPRSVWVRMYRGQIAKPVMMKVNSKTVFVMPSEEVAA